MSYRLYHGITRRPTLWGYMIWNSEQSITISPRFGRLVPHLYLEWYCILKRARWHANYTLGLVIKKAIGDGLNTSPVEKVRLFVILALMVNIIFWILAFGSGLHYHMSPTLYMREHLYNHNESIVSLRSRFNPLLGSLQLNTNVNTSLISDLLYPFKVQLSPATSLFIY